MAATIGAAGASCNGEPDKGRRPSPTRAVGQVQALEAWPPQQNGNPGKRRNRRKIVSRFRSRRKSSNWLLPIARLRHAPLVRATKAWTGARSIASAAARSEPARRPYRRFARFVGRAMDPWACRRTLDGATHRQCTQSVAAAARAALSSPPWPYGAGGDSQVCHVSSSPTHMTWARLRMQPSSGGSTLRNVLKLLRRARAR